jgi:molybdenum cofactor guanylyltransferase
VADATAGGAGRPGPDLPECDLADFDLAECDLAGAGLPDLDLADAGLPEFGLPEFDAVILAGGRAARLGGVDKPGLVVGSQTMAAAVTSAAAAAGARRAILVGPERPDLGQIAAALPGGLAVVREDPPGAGPVPALRAGLPEVRAPWVAVLAADLPFLRGGHIRALLAAALASAGEPPGAAGAVMTDAAGRAQWLAGCWQSARLRSALLAYDGASLRGLLGPLHPVLLAAGTVPGSAGPEGTGTASTGTASTGTGAPPPWLDCDTPAELAAARTWFAQPGG